MWIYYNPNPTGARVGDCSIRAICKATGDSWDKAYAATALSGFLLGDMPSSNAVWGSVLRERGFKREPMPDTFPKIKTAAEFCEEHPRGTYVLVFAGHVATVVDGDLYDSWDSSAEMPLYYYEREE